MVSKSNLQNKMIQSSLISNPVSSTSQSPTPTGQHTTFFILFFLCFLKKKRYISMYLYYFSFLDITGIK